MFTILWYYDIMFTCGKISLLSEWDICVQPKRVMSFVTTRVLHLFVPCMFFRLLRLPQCCFDSSFVTFVYIGHDHASCSAILPRLEKRMCIKSCFKLGERRSESRDIRDLARHLARLFTASKTRENIETIVDSPDDWWDKTKTLELSATSRSDRKRCLENWKENASVWYNDFVIDHNLFITKDSPSPAVLLITRPLDQRIHVHVYT
jgi:hypothetical protein